MQLWVPAGHRQNPKWASRWSSTTTTASHANNAGACGRYRTDWGLNWICSRPWSAAGRGSDDAGDDNSILPWKSLTHRMNILRYMCLLGRTACSWLLNYGCTCSPRIPQMKVVRTAQLGNYAWCFQSGAALEQRERDSPWPMGQERTDVATERVCVYMHVKCGWASVCYWNEEH